MTDSASRATCVEALSALIGALQDGGYTALEVNQAFAHFGYMRPAPSSLADQSALQGERDPLKQEFEEWAYVRDFDMAPCNPSSRLGVYASERTKGAWSAWQHCDANWRRAAAKQSAALDALIANGQEIEASAQGEAVASNEMLSYELLGVITDVEEGGGFDEVCLRTIKRVCEALAHPSAREAALEKALRELVDGIDKWGDLRGTVVLGAARAALGEGNHG